MTVPDQTPITRSTGNGVTTVFAYGFKILATEDLLVEVDDVALSYPADYSVSGVGVDGGGSITCTVAPASGTTVVRRLNMAFERETDYQDQGELPTQDLDDDFDRAVLLLQQLREILGRSLTLPPSYSGASTQLPIPEALALIGWNSAGDGLANYAGASSVPVSAAMTPVVAATTLALARAAMQVAGDGAIGSSGLTMNTGRALLRTSAGVGAVEEATAAQVAAFIQSSLSAAGKVQSITATMASNAITTTVAPTSLDFRRSTLTTGAPNTRTLASTDSITIPALASLGVPTTQSGRIVRLLIDNGGTLEGAVINLAGGVNLDETGLISTTAISGTATAANVAYSTTARTNVPYRVVGFFDAVWTSGTGWSAPTLVQGQGGQALGAMQSLGYGQTVQTGLTRTSGTTYYNTTGRPIFLVCLLQSNASSMSTSIAINGGSAVTFAYAFGASAIGSGSFVIPAGASYVLTDGGSVTSRTNTELR